MNIGVSIIKEQIINQVRAAYPGVLFVSVNMTANEMQLHYQSKVVTESTGVLSVSDDEMKMFLAMLNLPRVDKIHIFIEQKIVTFYGGGKKVNL